MKKIFTASLMGVFLTNAVFAAPDCNNATYRNAYPERCQYIKKSNTGNTFLAVMGGAALVGVGIALASQSSGDHGSSSTISNQNSFPRLTLSSNIYLNYDANDIIQNQKAVVDYTPSLTNGNDIDESIIQNIKNSAQYKRNYKQYDAINFAWANARGYSGKNVKINIIDNFSTYHGHVVNDIVKNIAYGAEINTYSIAKNQDLESFNDIANTINTASPANIYNASWQIPSSNEQNAATVVYKNQNSMKTYKEAQQYLYNATSDNFITQIRNSAIDNDAIFVWAAGNESKSESGALSALPIAFPELQGHFVNVVAVDNDQNIAWYSNQCGITQNYCIAAPGSAWNTDSSKFASGTSFATPVVSGAIATIKEAFPYMSSAQITELLFVTAKDLGEIGVDSVYGWGLLDMEKATRPVGDAKIVLSNNTVQPLSVSNMTGPAATAIKTANVKIAFVDDFGRAFTTNLSDKINVIPYGRGFDRLRESEFNSIDLFNGFEFGIKQNNLLQSNGLISTKDNNLMNFVGYKNEFNIDNIRFYQNVRFGMTNPKPDENSIVSGFSNIYTSSMKFGANWNDLSVEFAIPDMIMYGNMFLDIPVGQNVDGKIIYDNVALDLSTTPSTEYTVKYKHLSATYVNNPDMKNEFFIMARGHFAF